MNDRRDSLYEEAGRQFAPAIARLARVHEADADRARDLEQEIHCALWQSLARFDGRCALKTWVYRVAQNTATDHVRKHARAPRHVDLDEAVSTTIANEEAELGEAHALARVRVLIRDLPPVDAQTILLWLEGETAASIAEIVGSNAGAVATRTHRIRERLAAMFEEPAAAPATERA